MAPEKKEYGRDPPRCPCRTTDERERTQTTPDSCVSGPFEKTPDPEEVPSQDTQSKRRWNQSGFRLGWRTFHVGRSEGSREREERGDVKREEVWSRR